MDGGSSGCSGAITLASKDGYYYGRDLMDYGGTLLLSLYLDK
jgi:hypothetical protein